MMRLAIWIALLLGFAAAARADQGMMMTGMGWTTGGSPPACSTKLDFSQTCNSQYINTVVHL